MVSAEASIGIEVKGFLIQTEWYAKRTAVSNTKVLSLHQISEDNQQPIVMFLSGTVAKRAKRVDLHRDVGPCHRRWPHEFACEAKVLESVKFLLCSNRCRSSLEVPCGVS